MSTYEWNRSQLESAGVDDETRVDVLSLLAVWERIVFPSGDPRRERVLTVFTDLARGIAIEKEPDPGFTWVSALKAKPRQKDRVRIKRDAFDGQTGLQLNGKEGIIARVSRGTLVVALDGEGSLHVAPEKLETRVAVV